MFLYIYNIRLRKILGLPAGKGRGESYANTIPEMAPRTEREGGSPVKSNPEKTRISTCFGAFLTSSIRKVENLSKCSL